MLPALGEYDAPYGHGEVIFDDVRVPKDHIIVGPGAGFKIAQGRLGPGRIHHCMRAIGAAERRSICLSSAVHPYCVWATFIKVGWQYRTSRNLRVAIDQARLLTLHAAWQIDKMGAMKAIKRFHQLNWSRRKSCNVWWMKPCNCMVVPRCVMIRLYPIC